MQVGHLSLIFSYVDSLLFSSDNYVVPAYTSTHLVHLTPKLPRSLSPDSIQVYECANDR